MYVSAKPLSPIDALVGGRLRVRRRLLGLSPEAVGAAVGAHLGEVQKIERGERRLSPEQLVALMELLEVPVSYFFGECAP